MKHLKVGDLLYIPADVMLMEYDESIEMPEDPNNVYIGPSPVKFHNLQKPANVLLLEENNAPGEGMIPVLYNGEKFYIHKRDILPYQEGR